MDGERFKVGQLVKVVRKCKFPEESDSWWASQMDAMIGKEYLVDVVYGDGYVELGKWVFMPECLEPVEQAATPEFEK